MNEKNKVPRVVAITGGKGGVGKTSIAINLSIALSRTGSKVCLFDGDTGLANTNIMLGLYPAYTLEHLFTGERSIQDIVLEGPEGLHIVPGASGFAQCVDLDVGQQQRLVTSIRAIEPHYDYMVVDTAAGISATVLHFIAASQVAVIVITPEPTSLTDAFSLLKVLKRRGYRRKVEVLVNMVSSASQAKKVYQRFGQAVSKYLDLTTDYMGSVWMDESMRTAVTLQRPVALYPKEDPSARCFYRLAERLDDIFNQPGVPRLAFSAYWQKVVERQSSGRTRSQHSETLAANSIKQIQQQQKLQQQIQQQSNHHADEEPLTQIQKQLQDKVQMSAPYSSKDDEEEITVSQAKVKGQGRQSSRDNLGHEEPLSSHSEDAWLDLRLRMNQFFSDDNTTPEQVMTLLSSGIYSYGEKLGNASVDLLHGLLHALDPKQLSDEQKQLLLSDYERIGLDEFKQSRQAIKKKVRYDSSGFGDQQNLAKAIRSSAEDMPLESLLESIKYASLVDSSSGT